MTTSLQILNNIEISKPCPASWQSMTGDTQVRHCRECDRQVVNLSEMTADEAAGLLEEHAHDLCIRIHRRADGTVMNRGDAEPRKRRWRLAAWAASVVALLFHGGCAQKEAQTMQGLCGWREAPNSPAATLPSTVSKAEQPGASDTPPAPSKH